MRNASDVYVVAAIAPPTRMSNEIIYDATRAIMFWNRKLWRFPKYTWEILKCTREPLLDDRLACILCLEPAFNLRGCYAWVNWHAASQV